MKFAQLLIETKFLNASSFKTKFIEIRWKMPKLSLNQFYSQNDSCEYLRDRRMNFEKLVREAKFFNASSFKPNFIEIRWKMPELSWNHLFCTGHTFNVFDHRMKLHIIFNHV